MNSKCSKKHIKSFHFHFYALSHFRCNDPITYKCIFWCSSLPIITQCNSFSRMIRSSEVMLPLRHISRSHLCHDWRWLMLLLSWSGLLWSCALPGSIMCHKPPEHQSPISLLGQSDHMTRQLLSLNIKCLSLFPQSYFCMAWCHVMRSSCSRWCHHFGCVGGSQSS